VLYAQGCEILGNDTSGFQEAINYATKADVAVVVVGLNQSVEAEMLDRYQLYLPGVQEQLVQQVFATGTPTIVVLINGGPVSIEWIAANVDGIIEAWYPGQSGGTAIAEVLFGMYNPGGKLPMTIYMSNYVDQIPMTDMNMQPFPGRTYRYLQVPALFEFGYGLSYTQFDITWVNTSTPSIRLDKNFAAFFEATVSNIGSVGGDEVVQAYYVPAQPSTLNKQLFGFQRVYLDPGQEQTVYFTLPPQPLLKMDKNKRQLLHPGTYNVQIGQRVISFDIVGDAPIEFNESMHQLSALYPSVSFK